MLCYYTAPQKEEGRKALAFGQFSQRERTTFTVCTKVKRLSAYRLKDHEHPAAGDGVWGSQQEVPSFLYAMPLQPGRVFLEETCLVTKPALPFAVLKRRLERRLKAMGIKVSL